MKIELNRDQIKYIAVFTMLLNHVANIFLQPGTFACEALKDIGYFTAPVMCWFLVEGYRYTRSVKKYAGRLLIFAVISQLPYYLAFARNHLAPWYTLNMIFTLFLCLCLMIAEEKISDPGKKSLVVLGIIARQSMEFRRLVPADLRDETLRAVGALLYETDPFIYPAMFYSEADAAALLGAGITVTAELPGVAGIAAGAGAMIAVLAAGGCVLVFYNGKKSQKHFLVKKYFFYVFYPAHLVILALLKI